MGGENVEEASVLRRRKRRVGAVARSFLEKKGLLELVGAAKRPTRGGDRYELRGFKDPRLGAPQRYREMLQAKNELFEKNEEKEKKLKRKMKDRKKCDDKIAEEGSSRPKKKKKKKSMIEGGSKNELSLKSLLKLVRTIYPPDGKWYDEAMKRKEREIKKWEKNEMKDLRQLDTRCAKAALAFYNKKHSTDYKLVETLGTYCGIYEGFWYHCNFRAQRKSAAKSGVRLTPKLFFAELWEMTDDLTVKSCCILDGPGHRPYTVNGCEFCSKHLIHPINKFEVGDPREKPMEVLL